MEYEDLTITKEGEIQTVKLNRPKALNALRERTFHELDEVMDRFADDTETKVMIVTGTGDKAFSSGGDIKEMIKMANGEAAEFATLAHRVLQKMENLEKPILAAVNGIALGAGCDLAIGCDLIVASERAVFGEPPPAVGIITPFGGTQRLAKIIGQKRAKYLFFTGQTIDAETAHHIGLVNKVVKHENLMTETRNLAFKILTRAPIAIGFSKVLINSSRSKPLAEGDKMEIKFYAKCFETYDQKEGMKAFIEKRKPMFKGE